MSEATSALTYADLIREAAHRLGVGSYGLTGDGQLALPENEHDLAECQRHVNNAIRMFVNDGPEPNGWRWQQPVASVTVWGDLSSTPSTLISSAGMVDGVTTLTAAGDSFYPTMELRDITITGVGTFTIAAYVSATQIKVTGDATAASGSAWRIASTGNFTLPHTFGGQYNGQITYSAGSSQGTTIGWTSEAVIRQWREDITDETGDPFWAAVRPMTTGTPRRRWELMLHPEPDEVTVLEFPYTLHFDKLVDLDEVPPSPIGHDEAIKAAVRAVVEKDAEDAMGVDWNYYSRVALPKSHRVDLRSAPRRLGYMGDPSTGARPVGITTFRNQLYVRPNVTFNS